LDVEPITEVGDQTWHVSGMMSLRRLAKRLDVEIPETGSVTLRGIMQETLQKLCEVGDQCEWGPFELTVIEKPRRGNVLIELTLRESTEDAS
jgi:CBS domain containing-hemolysin-like protein